MSDRQARHLAQLNALPGLRPSPRINVLGAKSAMTSAKHDNERDDDKGDDERSTSVTLLCPTRRSPWPLPIATTIHYGQQHNNQIKVGKEDAWLKGRKGSGMIVGGQMI